MKKMSQLMVGMCALAVAWAANGEYIRVGDGGGNPDFVEGTWPAGTIVEVLGNIVVGNGTSLSIEEGTVVRFAPKASLLVQSSGELVVSGTAEQPVRLTSIQDGTGLGGNDRDAGLGDWGGIIVAGHGSFQHAEVFYGGIATQGLLTVRSGGRVEFRNGMIGHALKNGILNAGVLEVENSAIADAVTGLYLYPGSTAQVVNSVIDHMTLGVFQAGGDGLFLNCSISDYRKYGASYLDGDVHFERCNFYSDGEGSFLTATPMDASGTLLEPPGYVDAEALDFRLSAGSALIDAGEADGAPAQDAWGNPRVNAPGIEPTGTPRADGTYPDIGLHEWQPDFTTNDVDVVVRSVTIAESTAHPGDSLHVSWVLANEGTDAFAGTWTDALTLVPDYGAEVWLGEQESTGTLADGEEMTCSGVFTVPAVADRTWRIRVDANAGKGVFETADAYDNNAGESQGGVEVSAEALSLVSASTVELAPGASRVFLLTDLSEGGQGVQVSGGSAEWNGAGAFWNVPSEGQAWPSVRKGTDLWISIPAPPDGAPAYLALTSEAAGTLTLTVRPLGTAMNILRLDREVVTVSPNTSVTAEGVGLAQGVTGVLQHVQSGTMLRTELGGWSDNQRYAIFDLREAATGAYRFGIADAEGTTAWAEDEIQVSEAETGGRLTTDLLFSDVFHPGDVYEGRVFYANTGDADLPLPGLVVATYSYNDTELATRPDGPFGTEDLVLYGESPTVPACILKPGEHGEAVFYYRAESSLGLYADNAQRTVHYLTDEFPFKWQKVQDEIAAQEARGQAEQTRWDNQAPAELESVPLVEMGTLSGRLVEVGTENGLEGIPLILYSSEEGVGPKGPVTTTAGGAFLFTNLPTSGHFSFYSPEAEVDRDAEATYPEGSLEITGVVLEAERLFEICGVVTAGGDGLVGAKVIADNGKTRREAVTEIDGSYSIRGVVEDAYVVTVAGTGGYAGALSSNVVFDAASHVAVVDADLVPGVVWRGSLVPPEGSDEPLDGVYVQVSPTNGLLPPETALTDASGHFEFPGLGAETAYWYTIGGSRWEAADDDRIIETGTAGIMEQDLEVRPRVFFQIWPPVGQAPMEVGVEIPNPDIVPEGIVSWEWDFDGDGEADSTEPFATYTYETGGVYGVQLTVTDSQGQTTTYRVDEAVELIDEPICELDENVILLVETNADYRFVGAVSNADGFHLTVQQLAETPSQPMQAGCYLVIDGELEDVPNICQVVSCSKEGDVWSITAGPVEDMFQLFRKIQGFAYPLATEEEPQVGPQHRRGGRRGASSKPLVDGGGVKLTFDYSLPDENSFFSYCQWDKESPGIRPTIRLYFSHKFEAGLHLTAKGDNVRPPSPKETTIPLKTFGLEKCIAGSDLLKTGFFLYGKLTISAAYDYSISGHVDIDCKPNVTWLVELGYDNGTWKEPQTPQFDISPNRWMIAGSGNAHVYLRATIEGGVTGKVFNKGEEGNVAKVNIFGEAGPELSFSASESDAEVTVALKANYGGSLSFLEFLGDWAPPAKNWGDLPFPVGGELKMPAAVAKGASIACKDFLPLSDFQPGALLGAVPESCLPGGIGNYWGSGDLTAATLSAPSGWKLPDGVRFEHGKIPKLSKGNVKLPEFKNWSWDWSSMGQLGLDFSLKDFCGDNFDFEMYSLPGAQIHKPPNLKGEDLDKLSELRCFTLPDTSIKMALEVTGVHLPSVSASLPDWASKFENTPVAAYLEWGDGQKADLSLSDLEGSLRNLTGHKYEKGGLYLAKLVISNKFVNCFDTGMNFLIVVPDNDWDDDGMPNMWEMAFAADGAGLNVTGGDGGDDWDHDGLDNFTEFALGTNPLNEDSDGDGMPDGFEAKYIDKAGGKPGLQIWGNDANDDCDNDGLSNIEEFKGGPENNPVPEMRRGLEKQRAARRGGGDKESLNPVDKDTDGGGVADGREIEMGTDPTYKADDKEDCGCGQHAVRGEDGLYECENDESSSSGCGECEETTWEEDENGCQHAVCKSKDVCPDPPDEPGGSCWRTSDGSIVYRATCADGFDQEKAYNVKFVAKVPCPPPADTNEPVINIDYSLLEKGDGTSGGLYISFHSGTIRTIGCGDGHKDDPDPTDPDPNPTPDPDPQSESQSSAVYLVTGDYIDNETDLPVRMGGATAGLKRYLRNNEWTFWEAASGLSLGPGAGEEDEVTAGTGMLGVEWNGSGAPGAAVALTNEATGVSLGNVPTGLWGPWAGTTQALVRVEYGILRGNGTVATNYVELVKAWRAAVEAGDTETAAGLEAAATNGVVRVTAAEDAEGRRMTYSWNGSGLMTAAHFPDGTHETYEYGSDGLMSGKTMQDGEHVGLKHDNFGYLTGYNDMRYEYSYDGGSKTYYTTLRYPDGRVGERWYGEEGKLFRHAMNGVVIFDEAAVKTDALLAEKPAWPKEVLNDAELPVTVEYRSGAAEAFTWDGPGYARTSATESTGEELAWTYDEAGREMSETREGVARSVERDEAGNVTRERLDSASGTAEAEWAWDAAGNASEGRMGGWTRANTYDLAGRVLTAAGADGGTWTFTRDTAGRTTAWTQPDGESGSKTYDGRGRMTWRRSPGGTETWWQHATNGLLAGWSNSLGRKVSYQYDRGRRVAKETDEAGDVTTYAYDAAGNWRGLAPELRMFVNDGEGGLALAVTNGGRVTRARRLWGTWLLRDIQASDQTLRLERNEEGQVTGLARVPTEGTATTNSWTYDAAGRLSGWTDATGISSSRGYDSAGFVAWETNGAGGVRRWTHDGTGRLTGVTDAAGRMSEFACDPGTGTTTMTLADGSQLEVRTDAWGREIGRTDAAGTEIATERRFDGAVLRKTWTAAGAESAMLEATWTLDGDGRLVRQGMTGGPVTRAEWIGSNRCERTVTEFGEFEAGTAVQRGLAGRVTAVQGADGEWAECVYGDDGEASGWMLPEGSVWFARDLTERTRTAMLPSGQLLTERADLSGRVTNVALAGADGTVLWSLALVRDAAGRIVRQNAETLEWDGAERVVSAGGISYARDVAGNRSGSGWTTEGMDRLTAWPGGTYGYDSNGAVVSRTSGASELAFVRDLAGRVTEIRDGSDGLVARFAYDAEGCRLSKEVADGTMTWYLWSGDRLAAELSGEGTVERVYGYWTEEALSPDWVRAGGELYVVLKDGFGAAAALVSASDGAVTEATAGTVFGQGWSCAAMSVWADGLVADPETGLMAGADGRLYDPTTGRWLSPTPGAVEAGLNRYAWEPSSTGAGREFPGLSMPGVAPEYDVMYAFSRRYGADSSTAAALARAELLLGLEGRSDASARRWTRLRDETTAAAGLRLLDGVPADQVVCARKGVEGFLKARRDVLAVTTELDAYGKLRSAMDLEEAFRLVLAWAGEAEDRAAMGPWRGTWGWAGLRTEGTDASERWLALLRQAGNGERLSEEDLEWLGEAKLLALSDWVRPVTASLDAEKMRETASENVAELRRVLQMWVKECK